jgi:hypothetical protein
MGLKLKVFGLVRERVEVATVDLRGSLEQAKSRVIYISTLQPRQPCAELAPEADLAVTGGAHWTTRIPGNPLGD